MRVTGIVAAVVLVCACSDDAPGGLAPQVGSSTMSTGAMTSSSAGVGGGGGSSSTGGSTSSSTGSGAGTPAALGGTFEIIKEGVKQTFDYREDDGELVFCKHYPELGNYLWVRLAEDAESGGDLGPHLDIDICAYDGSGTFTAKDPYGGDCVGPAEWDVWWHEVQFSSFVSTDDAEPCNMQLNLSGSVLYGTFECVPLIQGTDQIELRQGTFACHVEEQ